MKGDVDEELDSDAIQDSDGGDSDDGIAMMTRTTSKRKLPLIRRATPPVSFRGDSNTCPVFLLYGKEKRKQIIFIITIVKDHLHDDSLC